MAHTVVVTSEPELQILQKHNPAWAGRMRDQELTSLMIIPLRREQTVVGFLYLVNFDAARVMKVKEIAELTGFFLGTQISNRLLMEQLEEMSYTDGLTGLSNRYALLRCLRRLKAEREKGSFGVVNLDLNGLKNVNDSKGHAAGDQLLVSAAEMLTEVFYQKDVFRTGGDEFIIIASGIDEKTFRRKLQRLRAAIAKDPKVSFAVGAFWSDGSMDVSDAFRMADEKMYTDKEAYYAAHPEQRRS